MVSLLLAHGAHPFLSTQLKDTLCYSGSAQRGCYSPISVAAAHGQRTVLQKLLAQPMAPVSKEVLSLEEMLAEGAGTVTQKDTMNPAANATAQFSKAQIKALQEAMYHSAENNHLGKITVIFDYLSNYKTCKIFYMFLTAELTIFYFIYVFRDNRRD